MSVQSGRNRRYKVEKGKKIYEKGRLRNEIGMIITGKAYVIGAYGKILFGSGTVFGLSDIKSQDYLFDCVAEEDCEILAYGIDESHDEEQIISANKQFAGLMISSVTKQASVMASVYDDLASQCSILYETLVENKKDYLEYCKKFSVVPGDIEEIEIQPISEGGKNVTIEKMDYCKNLNGIPLDILKTFFSQSSNVAYFNVVIISELIKELNDAIFNMLGYIHKYKNVLIGNEKKDLFYSYSILAFEVGKKGVDISVILRGIDRIMETVKEIPLIEKRIEEIAVTTHNKRMGLLYKVPGEDSEEDAEKEFKLHLSYTKDEIAKAREDIKGSLEHILSYAKLEPENQDNFMRLITSYGNLKDCLSADENASTIRKQITKVFYDIYERVFFNYIESGKKDTVIDMFLNFGYIDERLIDETQAIDLYYLNKSSGDKNVFMMKDWLTAIYTGKEEPSKNDFDIDYQENLREIKKSSLMTPEEEIKYLNDQKGKVIYEIHNMFKSTNKITYGRISTFCPVLSRQSLCNDVQKAYVSPDRINSIIKETIKVDYSLFYRECKYDNDKLENNNERIMKEVRPYFILMPNFGSRCIMWQDIAGRKKDTPARIVLSVFSIEDLSELLMETFARFRWELCKNMQGVRWSDITSKSLTSEYYDYLQFYKKNRELSEKSKEKIKIIVQKKGNNYKEVFANDYVQWIKYEAEGSPRLNSYVRDIMFSYCPFPKKMRDQLAENPMYSKIVKKFERDREAKLKRFENVRENILKANGVPGEDFDNNIAFYNM